MDEHSDSTQRSESKTAACSLSTAHRRARCSTRRSDSGRGGGVGHKDYLPPTVTAQRHIIAAVLADGSAFAQILLEIGPPCLLRDREDPTGCPCRAAAECSSHWFAPGYRTDAGAFRE